MIPSVYNGPFRLFCLPSGPYISIEAVRTFPESFAETNMCNVTVLLNGSATGIECSPPSVAVSLIVIHEAFVCTTDEHPGSVVVENVADALPGVNPFELPLSTVSC